MTNARKALGKLRLTMVHVLKLLKVGQTYAVFTYVSREGYEGVLIQGNDMIVYTCKKRCPHVNNYNYT